MTVKVAVSSRTDSLDDRTCEAIRGQIFFALSRFSCRIEEVTVRIANSGQTRRDSQHLCRLSVRMKRLGSFAVESVEEEALDAVSRAADRAARQVQRILERRREET